MEDEYKVVCALSNVAVFDDLDFASHGRPAIAELLVIILSPSHSQMNCRKR